METSDAVNYSYIYIGLLKLSGFIDDYKEYLLFYKRYMDDGIGLWNCNLPNLIEKFEEFFQWFNNWGRLKWTCTNFVPSLAFMDLTISIQDRRLHYRIYQKEHNLYL